MALVNLVEVPTEPRPSLGLSGDYLVAREQRVSALPDVMKIAIATIN